MRFLCSCFLTCMEKILTLLIKSVKFNDDQIQVDMNFTLGVSGMVEGIDKKQHI